MALPWPYKCKSGPIVLRSAPDLNTIDVLVEVTLIIANSKLIHTFHFHSKSCTVRDQISELDIWTSIAFHFQFIIWGISLGVGFPSAPLKKKSQK